MKTLCLLLTLSILNASETLTAFGRRWLVFDASDWKVEIHDGTEILELLKPREPLPGPRRPIQFALADTPVFTKVTIEADARPRARSLILVFAYRDAAHFDYAHLSTDTGTKISVHNGIFHVYGGERVRISAEAGPPAFAETNHWYHILLRHDGSKGTVDVSVDGREIPALTAVDMSLASGRVGLGSFDEVGDFRNVKISGN